MAETLKADIAKEVNISARRNDSFKLNLEVKNSSGLIDLNDLRDSVYPNYQAKMSIINNSGERVLSVYSYYWRDVIPNTTNHADNSSPNSSTEGHYSGDASDMGIDFTNANGTNGFVTVNVPHAYMIFQSGNYKYDLQIRKQESGTAGDEDVAEYTTWLYGTFILNADITQV